MALSASETVVVGIVSGVVGGGVVQGMRIWFDLYMEKRRVRRAALQEFIREIAALSVKVGAKVVSGDPDWDDREHWWPSLEKRISGFLERWGSDWTVRVRDQALHDMMTRVFFENASAHIAGLDEKRERFNEYIRAVSKGIDQARKRAFVLLGIKD